MSATVIQVEKLYKTFGNTLVLNGVSLLLNEGDRVALVGENGAGKSTLLKLMTQQLKADDGRITHLPPDEIGYLPQETILENDKETVHHYLAQVTGELAALQERLTAMETRMAEPLNPDELATLLEEYGQAQEQFEQKGGYDLEYRLEQVLQGLGLHHIGLDRSLNTLSGGERRRVALAGLLLRSPALLLLDEPTNHLDFVSLAWLETFLKQYPHTVLLVSHDRHFINRVVTIIAEMVPRHPKVTLYHGDYDFYLQERDREFEKRVTLYEEQQGEIHRLQQLIKQEAHSRGGGRAPRDGDKLQFKLRVATAQNTAAKSIQDAKTRLDQLEKEAIPQPKSRWRVNATFEPAVLHSQEVIRLHEVCKGYGERTLLDGVSLTVKNGERIVILAPNGTGKSTLLKLIMQWETADSGEVYVAPQAQIGYLDQEQRTLDHSRTVLAEYATVAQGTESELRSDLHRYCLFEGDIVWQTVGSLSEGQRQRLQLAKIATSGANLLLLDEPTNHLDLVTLEQLEKAYREFRGTMLVVSHDRWFVDAVATQVWALQDGRLIRQS